MFLSIPEPNNPDVMLTSNFSLATETIAALVQQIPNQPIVFKDDPLQVKRYEDALIAWGWKKFMDDLSDPEILVRLPMTKAAVRAMDTIEDFAKKNYFYDIKKFMVTGKSKRGWTTWTTVSLKNVFFVTFFLFLFLGGRRFKSIFCSSYRNGYDEP